MRFETLIRAFGEAVGEAVGEAMARSGKFEFRGDGEEATVPLAGLDTRGAAPERLKVALSASDVVRLRAGEVFAVEVEGDDEEALRFALADGILRIKRPRGKFGGNARIEITLPTVKGIAIGGAGTVEAEMLGPDARVGIGGSGTVRIHRIDGERLTARIGGAGRIEAAGRVDELSLAIGGAGKLAAPGLEVRTARIRIGGAGRAEFACDGEVEAKIGGVGDILVHGKPRVSLKAGGAGTLRCIPRNETPPASEAA